MERLFTWDNNQRGGQLVRQILEWFTLEMEGRRGEEEDEEEGGNYSLVIFSRGLEEFLCACKD